MHGEVICAQGERDRLIGRHRQKNKSADIQVLRQKDNVRKCEDIIILYTEEICMHGEVTCVQVLRQKDIRKRVYMFGQL